MDLEELWFRGLRRASQPYELRRLRRKGVAISSSAVISGRPLVSLTPGSAISIGARASLISSARFTALGVAHPIILTTLLKTAEISIGADSGLSGSTVCAAGRIAIGDRVLLGADVLVSDTDFHPVDLVPRRYAPLPLPESTNSGISIADDVFIGARAIVLGCLSIGCGSVIGAGSVVISNIPDHVVAAGNPCRVIRSLRV